MRIDIQVDRKRWLRGVAKQKKRIIKNRKKMVFAYANEVAMKARILAKERIEFSSTGDLVAGIQVIRTPKGATVFSLSKHSAYFEYGTGIYNVFGNGRKTPWFYRHPALGVVKTSGQEPNFFFRDAVAWTRANRKKIFKEVWR